MTLDKKVRNRECELTAFDLLARRWDTGSSICSVTFNNNHGVVGYTLGGGKIVLAHVAGNESAERRIHKSEEDDCSHPQRRPVIFVNQWNSQGRTTSFAGEPNEIE